MQGRSGGSLASGSSDLSHHSSLRRTAPWLQAGQADVGGEPHRSFPLGTRGRAGCKTPRGLAVSRARSTWIWSLTPRSRDPNENDDDQNQKRTTLLKSETP